MDWIGVAVLGGLVGLGELVARYRDAPVRAVLTLPAVLYFTVNSAASLAALAAVDTFGWTFGTATGSAVRWTQVLVAGSGWTGHGVVSFQKADVALSTFCLAREDQDAFGRQRAAAMEDRFKTLALGLAILNFMGEDVLTAAVQSLGPDIKDPQVAKSEQR